MNLLGVQRGLIVLAAWCCSETWLPAQNTNLLSGSPALPGAGFSVLRMLGALLFVLAVFLGGAWLCRHWQRLAIRQGKSPRLNVLEVKSLGQRHTLYVVGYDQQRMLVAASPSGVALISHLPESPGDTPGPISPSFADAIQQVLRHKS